MPCRSYEDDDSITISQLRANNDKLARIACKVLTEMENTGDATFVVLKDKEVREWWTKHKIADAAAQQEREAAVRLNRIRKEALDKLSAEERKVLGLE